MHTPAAQQQLQAQLRQLRKRFAQLHEDSLHAPIGERRGTGLLLAVREWAPPAFAVLKSRPA